MYSKPQQFSEELVLEPQSLACQPCTLPSHQLCGPGSHPLQILKIAHRSCCVAINSLRALALVARAGLVLSYKNQVTCLESPPSGASSSLAWQEDNLEWLGPCRMPELLQWRASAIQHLPQGCCHQTQADTLAVGRGWMEERKVVKLAVPDRLGEGVLGLYKMGLCMLQRLCSAMSPP